MNSKTLSKFATHENSAYPQLWRGCVGAWCPSLGPSGSWLHDYARYQQWWITITNATLATCWTIEDGDYALTLNAGGNDSYVSMGNPQWFDRGVISFSFWFKSTSTGGATVFVAKSVAGGAANRWWMTMNEYGAGTVAYRTGSTVTDAAIVSAGGYNDGKWHHVVAVHNGTSVSVYVDNALTTGSALASPANTTYAMMLGRYNNSAGGEGAAGSFPGSMDDVRFYNRALSSPEIRLLARRRGIAFTPRTRARATPEQAAATTNRRRRIICGSNC